MASTTASSTASSKAHSRSEPRCSGGGPQVRTGWAGGFRVLMSVGGGLGKSLSGHGTVTTLLAWPGGSAGTSLLRAAQQTWPGVSAQSAATSTASAEPAAVCRAVRGLSSSAT